MDGICFILDFEGEHEKQITEPFMKLIITSGLQELTVEILIGIYRK